MTQRDTNLGQVKQICKGPVAQEQQVRLAHTMICYGTLGMLPTEMLSDLVLEEARRPLCFASHHIVKCAHSQRLHGSTRTEHREYGLICSIVVKAPLKQDSKSNEIQVGIV